MDMDTHKKFPKSLEAELDINADNISDIGIWVTENPEVYNL